MFFSSHNSLPFVVIFTNISFVRDRLGNKMLDKNEERMKIEDWWRFRSEITSDTCPTRKQTDRNGLFITRKPLHRKI